MDTHLPLIPVLTLALLHTSIPSHWLCFVVVGKAQGWRRRQVIAVAAFAGAIHVLTTVALGIGVRVLGDAVFKSNEEMFTRASAVVLIAFGVAYLALHFTNVGHHHEADRRVPDRWAIATLVLAVTLSPCTAAIPFVVASAGRGWGGMLLVSVVLLVATVGNMMLWVGLVSLGVEKIQFRLFDRYEKLILGIVLAVLGAVMLLVGHHEH